MTDSMIKISLGGEVEVDFAPTGLVWRIDCPAEGLLESGGTPPPQTNGDKAKEKITQVTGHCCVLVIEDEPPIAMDIADI